MSRHRASGQPRLLAYDVTFTPAHCAGGSCFHSHADEPSLPVFAGLFDPVVRCDRTSAHGAHDITSDEGDFRCPGKSAAQLPAPIVVKRAQRAREAIRGGSR